MVSRRKLAALAACGAFSFVPSLDASAESASEISIDGAVRRAIEHNVEILSAAADVEAARGRLREAHALLASNPELELEQGARTGGAGAETVDRSASITQEVEIALQRGSRKSSARAELARSEALLDATKRRVVAGVKASFLLALAAREKLLFAVQVEELTKALRDAAKRREELGAGTALETNLAEIEWGDAKRSRIAAQRELVERTSDVGRLLSLRSSEMGVVIGELRRPASRSVTEESLRRAAGSSASTRAATYGVDAARAELALARKAVVPNLTVRGFWQSEAGGSEVIRGVGVGIPLPFFRRNQAELGAARAQLHRAEAEASFVGVSVDREVEVAWRRWRAAQEELEVFDENIVEKVEENLRLLQSSLAAGKSNLLDVLVVQRRLVDTRRDYLDALAAAGAADAEIDRLMDTEDGGR